MQFSKLIKTTSKLVAGALLAAGLISTTAAAQTNTYDQKNFKVTKQVALVGQNVWQNSVQTKPGQKVKFRVVVMNTGKGDLHQIQVWDTLPGGLTYNTGTLAFNGKAQAGPFFGAGINEGTLKTGATWVLTFQATTTDAGFGCRTLVNVAHAKHYRLGERHGSASVVVCKPKKVVPPPKPHHPPKAPPASQTPEVLPNTGPANVLGMAASVAGGGAIAFWAIDPLRRRLLS